MTSLLDTLHLRPHRVARGHDLARLPISLNLGAISVAEGIRAALSVAVLVALNEWLAWPPMAEAALGALFTCLCDAGGTVRERAPPLLTFGLLGAVLTAGLGLARGEGFALIVPLASLVIFLNSFVRIYGQSAQQVGNLLSVVAVLGLDRAVEPKQALVLALAFWGGNLWALLLTLVIWRVRPYRPARRAVAEAYRRLALMTGDLRRLALHEQAQDAQWESHSRAHRRAVREAIETARSAVLATVRARGPARGYAALGLIRLEAADQIFAALIALSDLLEQPCEPVPRAAICRALRRLQPLLLVIAQLLVPGEADTRGRIERSIAAIEAERAFLPADQPLSLVLEALIDRLRIAANMTTAASDPVSGTLPQEAARAGLWDRLSGPVKANLNWRSAPLRHALRAALIAAVAIGFTVIWYGPYERWLTITMVVTMQPYFAATLTRALERIGGTVLGGFLASGIAVVCHTPLAIAVALFPLAVIALSVRAVSFGLFMTALTPLIVLLSGLSRPETSELTIALMRALFTLAGGGLAVLGCLFLWPSWEPETRLAGEARAAIRAHGGFARAVLSVPLGEAEPAAVLPARRAAGLASNNLEASLQRALLEPAHAGQARLEAAMLIDAALRRMAGRLTAMQFDPTLARTLDPALWRRWRDWIDSSAQALARGAELSRRPGLPPSAGEAGEALSRIARQIEMMGLVMERLRA